jgi:hypothetical protein
MSGWKYGLIKVNVQDEGTEFEEQVNMLVELYPLGEDGEYDAFCRADLRSLQELDMARGDIVRDGINTFFFDNGEFIWDSEARSWDWIPDEE